MIVLFTDYGAADPYLGQVKAVLYDLAPHQNVVRLLADAPDRNPKASAYLLATFAPSFPQNAIFFAVVDPDVGSDPFQPVIFRVDQRWYVGPDNGQFDILARRAGALESWGIASGVPTACRRPFSGATSTRLFARCWPIPSFRPCAVLPGATVTAGLTTCKRSSTSIITAMR